MSESRVRVSLTDGTFEFEGSETFVASQIEKFATMIQAAVAVQWPGSADVAVDATRDAPPVAVEPPPEPATPPAPVVVAPPSPEVEFSDMYAPTVDGVQILKRVPGSSCAQRTVNGARLYLYGLQLLKKRDVASFGEIKNVCRAQGCYDSHNMAAYLKADQQAFVFAGDGKRQTVKLSAPGFHATAQLLANVRAGNNAMYRRRRRIAR